MDSHRRSIVKAASYRLMGSAGSAVIVYAFSGNLKLSVGAGLFDCVLKIGLYFLHERMWERIPYGREVRRPEYEI